MSLPMLPGYAQQQARRQSGGFSKGQVLTFRNGVRDHDLPEERSVTVPVDPGVPVPSDWKLADRALKFNCFFTEQSAITSSSGGGMVQRERPDGKRVRRCTLFYHLADGTMNILEPRVPNSGIPQGTLVRRHRVPRVPDSATDFLGAADLKIGNVLDVYAKQITIASADRDTQNMMVELHLATREGAAQQVDIPEDVFTTTRQDIDSSKRVRARSTENKDTLKQFLENDRKVLRFFCAWDDRDSAYGDLRKFKMHIFLTDNSVELVEMHSPNSGFERFTTFMSRQKPENFPDFADLYMGAKVEVFHRNFLLFDCDDSTRGFLRDLGVTQLDPLEVEDPDEAPQVSPPARTASQSKMEGTLTSLMVGENDLDTDNPNELYTGLTPKAPKPNFAKLLDNEGRVMRFSGTMVSERPEDAERKFVVGFYLADDTVGIFEPPQRNTGIQGGKFLQRRKVKNPQTGKMYKPEDFVIGARIFANSHEFILHSSDEYALKWMESRPGQYPQSDVSAVVDTLLHQARQLGGENGLRGLFDEIDADGNGFVTSEEFREALLRFGFQISEQQIVTVIRRFDLDGDGQISYQEFEAIFRED
jgi:EF-hand domain-containing protein 1